MKNKNMKSTSLTLTIIALFISTNIWSQDAKEINKKTIDLTKIDAMEMTSTLRIYDAKGRERVKQTATAYKRFGETTKIITRFVSPADVKGIGLLIYDNENKDDNMWIYLPTLRKVRRIVSSEKGKSFMGSEFSNADMSKPNLDDYTYNLIGSEQYEGKDCWQVESIPINEDIADENGFSKKVAWINKLNFQTYKVVYYDFDNEPYKEMLLRKYEEAGQGKFIIRKMEILNLQNGRKSILTIDQLQMGSALTENSFTPAALEK
jgi:outer membrane lipoprotein-sorting protein